MEWYPISSPSVSYSHMGNWYPLPSVTLNHSIIFLPVITVSLQLAKAQLIFHAYFPSGYLRIEFVGFLGLILIPCSLTFRTLPISILCCRAPTVKCTRVEMTMYKGRVALFEKQMQVLGLKTLNHQLKDHQYV